VSASYRVGKLTFVELGDGESVTTCPVDLTLTRRTEGTLDKAFKDGHISAESQSVRRITSAP
jgi:hypothetical protein